MTRLTPSAWQTWIVLALSLALACGLPLASRVIWAGVPAGAPVIHSATDEATVATMNANKLRLSDPTGTTGPVLCAMEFPVGPLAEVPGCDVVLIRGTTDCSTAGTNDLWCRWNGTTYVPSGGDTSTFARLDAEGELINPAQVTGSFLLRGAGPPAAGSCPHEKATYSDTVAFGDTYICYGLGQNWHLIGEQDASVSGVVPDTGATVTAIGPTNVTVSGGACLQTTGNNTTKTITAELVCGSDARGDILARGASTYQRLALGASGQVLKSDGTDTVYANPTAYLAFNAISGGGFVCTNPGPTNRYFTLGSTPSSTAAARSITVPTAFVALSITGHTDTAVPTGETFALTLHDDGVDTTVTCSIAAGSQDCQASGFAVTVAALSKIVIKGACSGGTTAVDSVFVMLGIR